MVVPRDSVVDECRDAGSDLHLVGSLTMVETFPCLVDKLIIANGSVNGKPVKCMRDTEVRSALFGRRWLSPKRF